MDPEKIRRIKQTGRFGSVGIEMGLAVAFGAFIGWKLDKWLGTQPYMLIFWSVAGVGAAFKAIYDAYKEAKKEIDEPDPPK